MAWLVAVEGPFSGALRLDDGACVVGRSAEAALTVSDPAVSRRHCELSPVDGGWSVRDLGSRTGTTVNGQRVSTSPLRHGDLLGVGATALRFVAPTHGDTHTIALDTKTRLASSVASEWRAQQLDGLLMLGERLVRARAARRVMAELSGWLRTDLSAAFAEAFRVTDGGAVSVFVVGEERGGPVEDLLDRSLANEEVLFDEARRVLLLPLSGAPPHVCVAHFAAEDPLPRPFELELAAGAARLAAGALATAPPRGAPHGVVTDDAAMRALLRQVERAGPSEVTVLIRGESGTGKELIARALHATSGRALEPFIEVNCGALSESLLEAELFGHERGAFTGAHDRRAGVFERADGGTLFLDEVAELSPSAQAKLLRVLETGRFERVGGVEPVETSARVVAATHRDLRAMIAAGEFREDLYFRLAVLELTVPALRERPGDVPLLAREFLERAGHGLRLGEDATRRLLAYRWPGNVRELRNAMEHACVMAESVEIGLADLPAYVTGAHVTGAHVTGAHVTGAHFTGAHFTGDRAAAVAGPLRLPASLREVEEAAVRAALEATGNNRSAAARLLGINRATLYAKLDLYGLR